MSVKLVSISGISMESQNGESAHANTESEDQEIATQYNHNYCRSPCALWRSICRWYLHILERFFTSTGKAIASHPWITICLCLLMIGICSVGFTRFKVENRTEKLFIPQDSQAIRDLSQADKYFGLKVREETVILEASPEANILTPNCFEEALKIHRKIMKIDSYFELCAKTTQTKSNTSESCMLLNPLEIFSFKDQDLVNISQKIGKTRRNFGWLMRNGRPLASNFVRLFGGVTKNASTGQLYARAIQMTYSMQDPEDEEKYSDVNNFEEAFIKTVISMEDEITCGKLYYSAGRSLDDAISESSGSDISLISITFTLMISFACTVLGKFKNPLTGHSLLANVGVFAVALGILSGFGLSMLAGVPFISMVGVLPFLVVGIGIDDMFIILDELDRHKPQDMVETVKAVMRNSGPTVTMTTLTDLVAFAVSTASPFPAIKYFCIYAALCLTCAYLMMVTYFIAIMTFDIQRIKSGRRDCLPLCRTPPAKEGQPAWDEPQSQISNKAMKMWAKFLMRPGTKVAVVILSLGLLGAGIYGTTLSNERFDRRMLAKDDSYFIKFLDAQEKYFNLSIPVSIVMTGNIKYEDTSTQDGIRKLSEIVKGNQYYNNATLSWFDIFMTFTEKANITITTKEQFMSSLKIFLNSSGQLFLEDIKLSENAEQIEASRIICHMKSSSSSEFQRDAMLTLRKDISSKTDLPAFPITKTFIFFEQYAVILSATIQSLVIAAVAILVITSPFLVDFTVTMLLFLGFVALILELFGLMYIWGVSLNSISMINLVMALGFSVDYSAHIAHAFVTSQEKTANERVIDSLSTLGASVLMGGLSTFIGMLVTAFASSEIFRIFFRMFFGIVVFGLLHGLCFLPVYLSFIFWKPAVAISSASRVSDAKKAKQGASHEMEATLPVVSNDLPDGEKNGKLPEGDGEVNGGFESVPNKPIQDVEDGLPGERTNVKSNFKQDSEDGSEENISENDAKVFTATVPDQNQEIKSEKREENLPDGQVTEVTV